mgnify:FL=1
MIIEVRSMKKVLIIIVVLLALGVIGYGIFYVATHDFGDAKRESKNTNVELNQNDIEAPEKDTVTLVDTKEIDGAFIQEYSFVMNSQEKTLEVQFLNRNNEDIKEQSLTGEFSGVTLYAYYEEYDEDVTVYDASMIDRSFNENNFSFIKGSDGESYLLIHTNIYDDGSGEEDKLYILNDTLEFVSNDLVDYGTSSSVGMSIMSTYTSYTLEDEEKPWYTDDFNACSSPSNCYINVKVEDNKIYYLVPVLIDVAEEENSDEEDAEEVMTYGELEERVYTIRDSKLEYEVVKRYTIIGVSGLTE